MTFNKGRAYEVRNRCVLTKCDRPFSLYFGEVLCVYLTRSDSSPVCRLPEVGGNNMAVSLLYKSAAVLFPEGKKDVLCVFLMRRV